MHDRRLVVVAVALVAVMIVGDAVVFGLDRASHGLISAGVSLPFATGLVLPLNNGRFVAASLDNKIAVVDHGAVTAHRTLDGTIGGLVQDGAGNVVAGTSSGTVYSLSPTTLSAKPSLHVDDRVVGLAAGPGQELVVGHGSGAFSREYFVSRYRPGSSAPTSTVQAQFTITALAMIQDVAVYGTINSRVVAVTRGGEVVWARTVPAPVTALAMVPAYGWTLAADQKGLLTLIDQDGQTLGSVKVSAFPLSAVAYDTATNSILVGDQQGNVHVLDNGGGTVLTRNIGSPGPVVAMADDGSGHFLVVSQSGTTSTLSSSKITSAARHDRLLPWWIAANVILALAAGVLALLSNRRRRRSGLRLARRTWAGRTGYLLVLPTIVLIAVFSYYPAISSLYYSFTDYSLRAPPVWVGLGNFRQILVHDSYFHVGLINMLIIIVTSFVKAITVPLLAAELVYWLKNQVSQYVFRTLFVLSTVVPALVLTLLWKRVYEPDGALNNLLRALGLDGWTRAWLGDENTALGAVIGVGFPYLTAFAFLILLGGLLAINRDLYDSAAIDGATRWQQFVNIDIAHLRPQLRILAFFAIAGSVEGFAGIFLLTQGGPGMATYVPALEMYLRISGGDLGYASAIGAILFVTILLVTIFVLRFRRQEAEIL